MQKQKDIKRQSDGFVVVVVIVIMVLIIIVGTLFMAGRVRIKESEEIVEGQTVKTLCITEKQDSTSSDVVSPKKKVSKKKTSKKSSSNVNDIIMFKAAGIF